MHKLPNDNTTKTGSAYPSRSDSNLVDKSNRSNLRRLIFQFALSSNSIISDAKRFMVNVRSYELSVKNDRTREALKGLGL